MLGSKGRFGVVAIAAALLTAGYSGAADADTVRLGGASAADDAPAQNLIQRVGDDDADTELVARGGFAAGGFRGGAGGRGGFVAGGYRGGGGGYARFGAAGYRGPNGGGAFVAGGSRGYRGGYGYYGGYRGGVRVGVGIGGYRGGYYGGYGYRGYYGGYGYRYGYRPYWGYRYPYWGYGGVRIGVGIGGYGYGGGYYSSPSYYYGGYGYYDPCTYGVADATYTDDLTLQIPLSTRQAMPRIDDNGTPPPQPNLNPAPNGPYRYDGGPSDPVPMPMTKPAPTTKGNSVPDRYVSLPAPTAAKKYSYAAYGEKREPTGEKRMVMPGDETKDLLVRADTK